MLKEDFYLKEDTDAIKYSEDSLERPYCIYRITNLIDGNTYVGKHLYKETPLDAYRGSGLLLRRAYEKYGISNFKKEILMFNIPESEINSLEKKFIKAEKNSKHSEYNIAPGGDGGIVWASDPPMKGRHQSDEAKKRLSQTHLGNTPWNKGKPANRETVEKMKATKRSRKETYEPPWNKGVPWSSEMKEKMGPRGYKWYNNGELEILTNTPPPGYEEGRIYEGKKGPRNEEVKNKIHLSKLRLFAKLRILKDRGIFKGTPNEFKKWLSNHKEYDVFPEEELVSVEKEITEEKYKESLKPKKFFDVSLRNKEKGEIFRFCKDNLYYEGKWASFDKWLLEGEFKNLYKLLELEDSPKEYINRVLRAHIKIGKNK